MLTKKMIETLFSKLNDKLALHGERAEIGIVGGTVMCLVFNARAATRDIDAIFEPTKVVRKLAKELSEEEGLNSDWLNDGAKAYIQGNFDRQDVLNLTHLRVWAPPADYMLAMKCISARWDTNDRDDVVFLIKTLKLKNPKRVFDLIEKYYPKNRVPPKTQFLIEEIFEQD